MQSYRDWILQHPKRIEQVEGFVRLAFLMITDRTNVLHTEAGFTALNALAYMHRAMASSEVVALNSLSFYHGMVREVQRLVELALRFRDSPHTWSVVILIEAVKLLMVCVANRAAAWRRCKAVLYVGRKGGSWLGYKETIVSSGAECFTVPKVDIPRRRFRDGGEVMQTDAVKGEEEACVSVHETLTFLADVTYAVRPVAMAVAHAQFSAAHPWRVWLAVLGCEVAGAIATRYLEKTKPNIVTLRLPPTVATLSPVLELGFLPLDASVVAERQRIVAYCLLRSPAFDKLFRRTIEGWFVSGGFARIPLLGAIASQGVHHLITLQEMCFFSTSAS